MLRAVIAPLSVRAHKCGQLSYTWSRRIYYKQQWRKLHQTCWQLSSKSDKSYTNTFFKTRDQQKAGKLDSNFVPEKLFKPRPLADKQGEQSYDGWQQDMDEGDTFGSLAESPEFKDKTGHDKGKRGDVDRQRLKWSKGLETDNQSNIPHFNSRKWLRHHGREAQPDSADNFEDSKSFEKPYNRYNYTDRKGPRHEQDTQSKFTANHDSYKRYDRQHSYDGERQGIKRDKRPMSKQSQQWSDTFGLLSAEGDNTDLKHDEKFEQELLHDELEEKPHIPLGTYNRKHTAAWYSRRIMKLGKQGKVREAIDVFDRWMIKEDRVKPTAFEFSVLIHVLGQVGYTRKAFQLYNQMIRMGIKDIYSPHLFTSLFNACANSPWPDDGLARARKLRTRMLVKGIVPNYIIYNAMIKAYGMCGDIDTAFALADEAAHFYRPDNNLLGSLLVACITDKDSGFRHAIMVWRKMRTMGIEPELKDYCLLLRAVNECGIGSPELAKDLLTSVELPRAELKAGNDRETDIRNMKSKNNKARKMKIFGEIDVALSKYVEDSYTLNAIETESGFDDTSKVNLEDKLTDLEVQKDSVHDTENSGTLHDSREWWQMDVFLKNSDETNAVDSALDLNPEHNALDPSNHFPQGLPLNKIKDGESRLAVIGGYRKLLGALEERNIKGDIVFFTQLMLSTPADCEDLLLDEMDMANVRPDITFYNLLVRKRAYRFDYEGAKKLMKMMDEHDLVPDIKTYGCLALTCTKSVQGYQLLESMEEANIQPNTEIMTALINRSDNRFKFNIHILKTMEKMGIQPKRRFLETMERKITFARKMLAQKERNLQPGEDYKEFAQRLQYFIDYYDEWTKRMELAKPDHPWESYWEKKETTSNP